MAKSVLITGCSDNGLGSALAIAFKKAGYRVLASGRNLSKLGQVTAAGCETVRLDVTADLTDAVAEVTKKLNGKLDILVNNAGGMTALPITDLKLDQVRNLFELNTFSLISITQAFFPLLKAAQGLIVNNTSVASVLSLPMQGAYNASKAAASSLTQTLRLEMAPFGIKVVELRTGAVKSTIFSNVPTDTDVLPADSAYAIAADVINPNLQGGQFTATAEPADVWATRIVSDLSKSNPPSMIWRGTSAGLLRIALMLPSSILDSQMSKMMGMDVLTSRLRAKSTAGT